MSIQERQGKGRRLSDNNRLSVMVKKGDSIIEVENVSQGELPFVLISLGVYGGGVYDAAPQSSVIGQQADLTDTGERAEYTGPEGWVRVDIPPEERSSNEQFALVDGDRPKVYDNGIVSEWQRWAEGVLEGMSSRLDALSRRVDALTVGTAEVRDRLTVRIDAIVDQVDHLSGQIVRAGEMDGFLERRGVETNERIEDVIRRLDEADERLTARFNEEGLLRRDLGLLTDRVDAAERHFGREVVDPDAGLPEEGKQQIIFEPPDGSATAVAVMVHMGMAQTFLDSLIHTIQAAGWKLTMTHKAVGEWREYDFDRYSQCNVWYDFAPGLEVQCTLLAGHKESPDRHDFGPSYGGTGYDPFRLHVRGPR